MSDTGTQGDEPEGIKALRAAAAEGNTAKAELITARREMAFLRAGIDTTKGVGKLMVAAWDGDIEDTEAIKAFAQENGALPVVQGENLSAEDIAAQQLATNRQRLAAGEGSPVGAGGQGEGADPWTEAFDEFQNDLKAGKGTEKARLSFIEKIMLKAVEGDPRVIFNQQAWDTDAANESRRMITRPDGSVAA